MMRCLACQTPAAVVAVPGGARTPMASMMEADGTLTVYYTSWIKGPSGALLERVFRGSFHVDVIF